MKRLFLIILGTTFLLTSVVLADRYLQKPTKSTTQKATSIASAWRALPRIAGHGCGDDLIFDYKEDGGMRNFFCRALTVFSWKTFLSLAPEAPFSSGPHGSGRLNLSSKKDFGRYNPKFVRWATHALVPAASDSRLRQETQLSYNRYAATLARVYYRVWRVMEANPKWVRSEVNYYLNAADRGAVDTMGTAMDLYHDMLGTSSNDWGGADPNHVRSATAWWLRRHHDKTAILWVTGLQRLLTTYDAAWLEKENTKTPAKPPKRARTKRPEYR